MEAIRARSRETGSMYTEVVKQAALSHLQNAEGSP